MAISRIYTNGFENGKISSPVTNWSGQSHAEPDIDSGTADAKTGTYWLHCDDLEGCYWEFSDTYDQLRVGHWWKVVQLQAGDSPPIWGFANGTAKIVSTTYDGADLVWMTGDPDAPDTILGTVTSATLNQTGVWVHIGLDVKIGTAGWLYMYIDGDSAFTYDGDLTDRGTAINRFWFFPNWRFATQSINMGMDDLYIDSAIGESAPASLDLYQYAPIFGTADHLTEFLGSDGNSTDNYALTDDTPLSTATYTQSGTIGHYDVYEADAYTIPANYQVASVIPTWVALNNDGSGTAKLVGVVATDAGTVENGTAPDMATSPKHSWNRYTAKPGGGLWDQSAIDSLKLGVKVTA